MKTQIMFLAMTAVLLGTACSSQPKEANTEPAPAPMEAAAPAPAPVAEAPKTDIQACEGKGARDACSYTSESGEVKGTCVRSATYALQCLPKKAKKK